MSKEYKSPFADIIDDTPIEKELNYNGKTRPVFFKRLTGDQRLQLVRGQRGSVKDGATSFELDMGDQVARAQLMTSFSLCDVDGKPLYKNVGDFRREPEGLINALTNLCAEALKDEDDLGNS